MDWFRFGEKTPIIRILFYVPSIALLTKKRDRAGYYVGSANGLIVFL